MLLQAPPRVESEGENCFCTHSFYTIWADCVKMSQSEMWNIIRSHIMEQQVYNSTSFLPGFLMQQALMALHSYGNDDDGFANSVTIYLSNCSLPTQTLWWKMGYDSKSWVPLTKNGLWIYTWVMTHWQTFVCIHVGQLFSLQSHTMSWCFTTFWAFYYKY